MSAAGTPFESQARLWLVAFLASALINVLALGVIGFWVLAKIALRPHVPPAEAAQTVALIMPQVVEEAASPAAGVPVEPVVSPPKPPSYARTSPDQAEVVPEKPDFIGERNTQATSDTAALADAPDLPSQKGREPLSDDEIETTESNYQDGDLAHNRSAAPEVPPMPAPTPADPAAVTDEAVKPAEPAEPMKQIGSEDGPPSLPQPEPAKEHLAEGPLPVDRRVEAKESAEESLKPSPPQRKSEGAVEGTAEAKEAVAEKTPKAVPSKPAVSSQSPGFRGNQTKTRLEGSITRTGRSALNVEDSLLGRYHASVGRAVEKEWQRNCVRNRDYITPGQLTMSFLLDASGKPRSITVIEEIEVGAIPKGFTLNSIRDAEIPGMPADLKKQLEGEPLELIYRFNF